ncbi:hypothetical protein Golob_026464 [Gossypium lobatum]|uniref:Uncharacterized protein n=1 Tax=Gossypium lobatum TaxID=34289 RepID=A0A7J8LV90_9ROSI|nr:hypothetical protein [Gossypium lobatum]
MTVQLQQSFPSPFPQPPNQSPTTTLSISPTTFLPS